MLTNNTTDQLKENKRLLEALMLKLGDFTPPESIEKMCKSCKNRYDSSAFDEGSEICVGCVNFGEKT